MAKVGLSRSLLHFTTLIERSRKNDWKLVALDIGVDTSEAQGEVFANTIANFAQFERRLIGDRTRDALAIKKAQGVRLGRPRTLPDQVVEDMLAERRDGATYVAIADDLNVRAMATAQGGKRWYPATVRKVVATYDKGE